MGSAMAFVVISFATLAVTVAVNIRPAADAKAQPVPAIQSDTVPGRYLPPVPHEPDPVALPIAVVSPRPLRRPRRGSGPTRSRCPITCRRPRRRSQPGPVPPAPEVPPIPVPPTVFPPWNPFPMPCGSHVDDDHNDVRPPRPTSPTTTTTTSPTTTRPLRPTDDQPTTTTTTTTTSSAPPPPNSRRADPLTSRLLSRLSLLRWHLPPRRRQLLHPRLRSPASPRACTRGSCTRRSRT